MVHILSSIKPKLRDETSGSSDNHYVLHQVKGPTLIQRSVLFELKSLYGFSIFNMEALINYGNQQMALEASTIKL